MRKSILLASILVVLALPVASGAAYAANCSIELKAGDSIKFDQRTVTVSASCSTITVHLVHQGQLPVQTMGHNVVITSSEVAQAVANDGLKAGLAGNYVPPNDKRVIASTRMVGGGETATTTFPGSALKPGGAYTFFCSAPGHWALMRGQLVVQ